jgi:hypothetical protein
VSGGRITAWLSSRRFKIFHISFHTSSASSNNNRATKAFKNHACCMVKKADQEKYSNTIKLRLHM